MFGWVTYTETSQMKPATKRDFGKKRAGSLSQSQSFGLSLSKCKELDSTIKETTNSTIKRRNSVKNIASSELKLG